MPKLDKIIKGLRDIICIMAKIVKKKEEPVVEVRKPDPNLPLNKQREFR